jgi:hypothetical protein
VRAATYEISVEGILPERDRTEFDGMQVLVGSRVTVLTGLVDQAALHGVLARLEALGLRLLEVRKRPPAKGAKPW